MPHQILPSRLGGTPPCRDKQPTQPSRGQPTRLAYRFSVLKALMRQRALGLPLLAITATLLSACSSLPTIQRDPTEARHDTAIYVATRDTIDTRYVTEVTKNMVDSLLEFPPIQQLAKNHPSLGVLDFQNRTAAPLNTRDFSRLLSRQIDKKSPFRIEKQHPEAANYRLSGEIKEGDNNFILNLKLVDAASGMLIWEDQTKIRTEKAS